jgi:hypothetical protein
VPVAWLLEINQCPRSDKSAGLQQSTQFTGPVVVEWRVEEHDIVGENGVALQEVECILLQHPGSRGVQGRRIFAENGSRCCGPLHEVDGFRTPRQRFEAQGSAAGKQVETMCPANVRREPVEQCFAYALRCRPQPGGVGNRQQTTAPFSRYNTQPAAC